MKRKRKVYIKGGDSIFKDWQRLIIVFDKYYLGVYMSNPMLPIFTEIDNTAEDYIKYSPIEFIELNQSISETLTKKIIENFYD